MNRSAPRKQASEAQVAALLDEVSVREAKLIERFNELIKRAPRPRYRVGVELNDHLKRGVTSYKFLHSEQRLLFGSFNVDLDHVHGRPPQLAEEGIQGYCVDRDGLGLQG